MSSLLFIESQASPDQSLPSAWAAVGPPLPCGAWRCHGRARCFALEVLGGAASTLRLHRCFGDSIKKHGD